MTRVLIASTVVLAAALAFLVHQRFETPAPIPATASEAHAEPPGPAREEPPAASGPTAPPGTSSPAAAVPPAGAEARAAPGARPLGKVAATPPDAAAAIFADRPAVDGEGSRPRTPRIPVLRKPPAGMAAAPSGAVAARVRPAPAAPPGPAAGTRRARAPSTRGHDPAPPAPQEAAPPSWPAGPTVPLSGAISGTLRGAAGLPFAGAPILAISAGGDDAFETITDDDGFYLLAGLKAGRYLLFSGLGTRAAPALPARAMEVQGGRVARLDLRQPGAGATVRVRALGADGQPLPGQALLVAGAPPGQTAFPALLRSDAIFLPEAGGQNLLRRVPPGVYTLVLVQGADAPLRVATAPVAVRGDGEQLVEARFPDGAAAAPAGLATGTPAASSR